jgi:V/A-type H+-transporting ATPase subunit C
MGALIDRVNLVWLLRYRFNYNLPPAQVYFLLVGSHYSLPSSRLRELASQNRLEDVLASLPEELGRTLHGATEIPEVFQRMEQSAAETARKVLHSGAPAISRAFAYLLLRERDMRAVRALLRGRHLGLSLADIRQAMYQPSEGNA